MPVTPFHLGPGTALHALAPRRVSFLSFFAANVLIDVESGYNLLRGADRVHAFLHTWVGATAVVLVVVLLHALAQTVAARIALPDLFEWRELTRAQVATGAVLGAYSHILLDSIMHHDMTPFAPFSERNPLLGLVSVSTLHVACVAAGVVGVVILIATGRITLRR